MRRATRNLIQSPTVMSQGDSLFVSALYHLLQDGLRVSDSISATSSSISFVLLIHSTEGHFTMSTKSPGSASKSSSSKKRKTGGSVSERPVKQSKKLDGYFSQLYPVSSNAKESESQPMPLNDEQKRVLEMVVDKGENVFFTGAAGTCFTPPHKHPSFVAFAVADLAFVSSTRNREVTTTSSYHCGPQEKTREEAGRRFCHSQHGDGRFKHWRYAIFPSSARRNSTFESFYGISDLAWIDLLTSLRHAWQE